MSGPFSGFDDAAQVLLNFMMFRHGGFGQSGTAHNPGQEIVKIVRDAASQDTQALEFLRLAHLLLADHSIGDAADNASEAGSPAGGVILSIAPDPDPCDVAAGTD